MSVPLIISTMPLFMGPIVAEMGWSRTQYSSFQVIIGVMVALGAPAVGYILDRWGPVRLVLTGVPLYALTLAGLTLLSRDPRLGYVLYGLAGMAVITCSAMSFQKMTILWFHRRRGLAIAVLSGAAMAFGNASAPWLARSFIDDFGWRGAYLCLAALVLLVNWPMQLLLLRVPKVVSRDGTETPARPLQTYGVSAKAAFLTPTIWLMLSAVSLNNASTAAVTFHLFQLLRDRNISATIATSALSLLPLFSLGGFLLAGLLLDRVNRPQIAVPFFLIATAGAVMVALSSSTTMLLLGVAMLGFGAGGDGPVLGYFVTRYFGLRSWARIAGWLFSLGAIFTTAGPVMMAASYDRTNSYQMGFTIVVGALVLSTILICLLGRYRFTATGQVAADGANNETAADTPILRAR
jgi:MFS family permease